MQSLSMGKRLRILCTTGIKLLTSVVFPGHISEQTGVPSLSINDAHDHLVQIGAMVLGVAELANCSAFSLKIEGGGIEEHDIECAE